MTPAKTPAEKKPTMDRNREVAFERSMSDQEALMWNIEKDPWMNPNGSALTILDRPVDFDLMVDGRFSDARAYRTRDEERQWRERDPIDVFARKLTDSGPPPADAIAELSDRFGLPFSRPDWLADVIDGTDRPAERRGRGHPGGRMVIDMRSQLVKAKQQVAAAMLADPDFALRANVDALARRAKVSPPTIVRFCRAMGFAGLRDFKLHLAQSLAVGTSTLHRAVVPGDDMQAVTHKILQGAASALANLEQHIAPEDIERALGLPIIAVVPLFEMRR